ncbi:MAG: hypothetical protein NC037_01260 [Bacteroides sp.]|nr:hypothetical protein [Bacillota bacterium]MCM1393948.1 hypothetical protein [[Eubacterium] siraeum]MCM1455144.1 hypothetical protein [Bacteroides sp.]
MKTEDFKNYMRATTYFDKRGVERSYTEKSVNKRISSLRRVESGLNINIDDFISSSAETKNILMQIENNNLEKAYEHRPLQNAVRHYYKFMNGEEL